MIEKLRADAATLLKKGEVHVIIGYGKSFDEKHAAPIFIKNEKDVSRLLFNSYCFSNLAVFLTHEEIKKMGKAAIVAKENDMKTIIALVQESQIDPEHILILGIEAGEMTNTNGKWQYLGVMDLNKITSYINEYHSGFGMSDTAYNLLNKIEKMSYKERREFWNSEFNKCIRCYACRQACPLCYCAHCIAEKNQPQWISTNINETGKWTWNIVRAYHLAGRCIGCGECERVCPMGIPLMTINLFLSKIVFNEFAYLPGHSTAEHPVFTTFNENDSENFITEDFNEYN